MKKLISFILTLSFVFAAIPYSAVSVFAEDSVQQLSASIVAENGNSEITVKKDDTFAVNLSIDNNPGIVSLENSIAYDDSRFQLIGVYAGDFDGNFFSNSDYDEFPYPMLWYNADSSSDDTSSGTIAKLLFKVKSDCEDGESYIDIISLRAFNTDNKEVSATVNPAKVKVVQFRYGDVNADGQVSMADASYLIRNLVREKGYTITFPEAADVDGLPGITVNDVVVILRHIANWSGYETLPIGSESAGDDTPVVPVIPDVDYAAIQGTKAAVYYVDYNMAQAFANGSVASVAALGFSYPITNGNEFATFSLVGVNALSEIREDDIIELYLDGGNYYMNADTVAVVRNKVTGPITSISTKNPVKYTMNGRDFVVADMVDAYNCWLPYAEIVKAGTPFAFYLDSAGKIAACGYAEKTKVQPVVSYVAFALTGAATKITNMFSETKGWTTSASTTIELLTVGETEAKTYVITGDAIWLAKVYCIQPSSLVAFTMNSKAEISTLEALWLSTSYNVFVDRYGFDGYLIADDAKVFVADTSKVPTDQSYYVEKTAADIKNATWASIEYMVDNGRISFIFAKPAPKAIKVVQKYGFFEDVYYVNIGNNAVCKEASLYMMGLGNQSYIATNAAYDVDMMQIDTQAIYAVTIAENKLLDYAIKVPDYTIMTTAGVKIDGNCITMDGSLVAVFEEGTVFLTYDETIQSLVVVEDVAVAINAGQMIELYDLITDSGMNTWYDLVVIK